MNRILSSTIGMGAFVALVSASSALALSTDVRVGATARVGDRASTTVEARMQARQDAQATRMSDRAEKAKERANTEIDRRVKMLTELNTRVADMVRVSGAGKTDIDATVQSQISALNVLRTKIGADSDIDTLKTDMQSITQSYRIFMLIIPQGHIKVAAEKIKATADILAALSTKLSTRITSAQQAGKNTAALTTAVTDMNAKIADAKVQADAAVALVVNLTPDNGDKTQMDANMKSLKDARAKIQAGLKDIQAARADAKTIVNGIKGFHLDATASTSAAVSQ